MVTEMQKMDGYYAAVCSGCGKQFRLDPEGNETKCYECRRKDATGMITEKQEINTYYTTVCSVCGKEFRVDPEGNETKCHDCRGKEAREIATEQLSCFVGAEIVSIKPTDKGAYTSEYVLTEIEIVTIKGEHFIITSDYDDMGPYMEWEAK